MQNQPQVIYVPVYAQPTSNGAQPMPAFVYPNQAGMPMFQFPEAQAMPQPEYHVQPPQFVQAVYEQPAVPMKQVMPSFQEELQNVDFALDEYQREISVRSWFRRGWRLYRQDWLAYSLFQAIIILSMFVAYLGQDFFMIYNSPLSLVFAVAHLFIWPLHFGPFIAGSHIVRQADGSRGLSTSHFYNAFKLYFPLLVIVMILEFLIGFGFFLFVLPGIYLGVTLSFAPFVYIEYHHHTNPLYSVGIFSAIGHSHSVIRPFFWKMLGFFIICGVMNLAAFMFFFFGLVITMPLCMLAAVFAFRDLFQLHPDKVPDSHCYCCC